MHSEKVRRHSSREWAEIAFHNSVYYVLFWIRHGEWNWFFSPESLLLHQTPHAGPEVNNVLCFPLKWAIKTQKQSH